MQHPSQEKNGDQTLREINKNAFEDVLSPTSESGTGFAYLLRETHRQCTRVLGDLIRVEGLTPGMWYLLCTLWDEDGLSQRTLSRRIGIMDPTTGSALARMEDRGLIERREDPTDRRRRLVYLTKKGRDLCDMGDRVQLRLLQAGTSQMETEEAEVFLDLLQKVFVGLKQPLPAT